MDFFGLSSELKPSAEMAKCRNGQVPIADSWLLFWSQSFLFSPSAPLTSKTLFPQLAGGCHYYGPQLALSIPRTSGLMRLLLLFACAFFCFFFLSEGHCYGHNLPASLRRWMDPKIAHDCKLLDECGKRRQVHGGWSIFSKLCNQAWDSYPVRLSNSVAA